MRVKIISKSAHTLPAYETVNAAGMDLKAFIPESVTLAALERKLIPTGIHIELPEGFEAQVRPRSGMALKHGLTVLNSPGTIDSDYRGEIKVLLVNLSSETYTVKDGDRIAQMVIARHETIQWEQVSELSETRRGEGGYGHTGLGHTGLK